MKLKRNAIQIKVKWARIQTFSDNYYYQEWKLRRSIINFKLRICMEHQSNMEIQ